MFNRALFLALGLFALTWVLPVNAPLSQTSIANACSAAPVATAEGLLPTDDRVMSAGAELFSEDPTSTQAPANAKLEITTRYIGSAGTVWLSINLSPFGTITGAGSTGKLTVPSGSTRIEIDYDGCGGTGAYQVSITCRALRGFGPVIAKTTTSTVGLIFDLPANADAVCAIVAVAASEYSCFNTSYNVIVGTEGLDRLTGTEGNDLILGLGGNDIIDARGSNDCVIGGDGSDSIDLGSGNDVGHGEGGHDTIRGGTGNDRILGGSGLDTINGGNDTDTCSGEFVTACETPDI